MPKKKPKTYCEGSCSGHYGEVCPVRITKNGSVFNGMEFNYCEEAVREDISRGFDVQHR